MRGLVVPDTEEDFTADPVELFFDLAFVFAFSQLVAHLVHYPTWTGAGESALLFLIIWLNWSWFTWLANTVSGNSRIVRLVFLVATAITVPMAASVDSAFDEGGFTFATAAAGIMLISNVLSVVGQERGSQQWRAAVELSAPNLLTIVLLVAGGFVDGSARVVLWCLAMAVILTGTAFAGRNEWVMRTGHFAERHGLILIIALGEVIVAIGIAVVNGFDEDGSGLTVDTRIGLTAAGVLAGLLWWAYFDRVLPALEHRGESLDPHPKSRYARDVYTWSHAPIIGGIIVAAAAAEEILLHPSDATPASFRWMFAIGLAMFLGGIGIAVFRAFRIIAKERLVGLAAIALLCTTSASWDGVWLLVAVDAVLLLVLAAEHWRIEVQPTGPAPRTKATSPTT